MKMFVTRVARCTRQIGSMVPTCACVGDKPTSIASRDFNARTCAHVSHCRPRLRAQGGRRMYKQATRACLSADCSCTAGTDSDLAPAGLIEFSPRDLVVNEARADGTFHSEVPCVRDKRRACCTDEIAIVRVAARKLSRCDLVPTRDQSRSCSLFLRMCRR